MIKHQHLTHNEYARKKKKNKIVQKMGKKDQSLSSSAKAIIK